jgi:uncharacterized protein
MPASVPIVEYLALQEPPHLVAQRCTSCHASYFGRRDACASCFGTTFAPFDVSRNGTLETFTVVAVAAPGVKVPFVAGVVNCDGIAVRSNIVNVGTTPDALVLGMPVRLTTFVVGTDDNGTQAVGFGFEPVNSDKGGR